jgi:hypothetical protein
MGLGGSAGSDAAGEHSDEKPIERHPTAMIRHADLCDAVETD